MQRLSEQLIREAADRTLRSFEACGRGYRRGFFDGREFYRKMYAELHKGFWQFLSQHGLKLMLCAENYAAFRWDCRSSHEPEKPGASAQIPWLQEEGGIAKAASEEDKRLVIRLMAEYGLTPEFFAPGPEAACRPSRTFVHGYRDAAVYSIPFLCVDDGGLLQDEDPVGKTFELTSDLRLKAAVTIKEDRRHWKREDRNKLDFDEVIYPTGKGILVQNADFLAEGRIEGYTLQKRTGDPELLIRLDPFRQPKQIESLAYWENADDRDAFLQYPLWQEHFRLGRQAALKEEEFLTRVFEKYKG